MAGGRTECCAPRAAGTTSPGRTSGTGNGRKKRSKASLRHASLPLAPIPPSTLSTRAAFMLLCVDEPGHSAEGTTALMPGTLRRLPRHTDAGTSGVCLRATSRTEWATSAQPRTVTSCYRGCVAAGPPVRRASPLIERARSLRKCRAKGTTIYCGSHMLARDCCLTKTS